MSEAPPGGRGRVEPEAATATSGDRQRLAAELMAAFATRTGLAPTATPRRYLWTDAFAVCNYLGLRRAFAEPAYLDLTHRLVEQVHHVLGRHRPDDSRRGWISGLDEAAGERHPTRGGLRIGKELPERGPNEPYDPRLEWERDGQYFHYLTQWMHALHRVSQETGEPSFRRWARELAVAAHAGFTLQPPQGGAPRLAWKMSIDLCRPLVPTTGHHDPLDALVSYLELETAEPRADSARAGPSLAREIRSAAEMCAGREWATADALGIGGLLIAAARLSDLTLHGRGDHLPLLRQLLVESAASLRAVARDPTFTLPAGQRLAFRELGMAIGLQAVERVHDQWIARDELAPAAGVIDSFLDLATRIERFWADPANRRDRGWRDHAEINTVTLATSLLPDGYLGLPRV